MRGYGNTGIREIALEAGATEAAVYRHFGSKRGLFEAAVSEPYESFFTDYMDAWRRRGAPNALSNQEVVEGFEADGSDPGRARSPGLHAQLAPVESWVRREQEARGVPRPRCSGQLLDTMVPLALWGLARHPPEPSAG